MAFLNSVFQRADTFIQRIGEVVAPVEGPAQELQIAIRKHDWPTTQRLLQENFFGGDALNQPLGSDCTPLHLAAEADFVPCVEYCVKNQPVRRVHPINLRKDISRRRRCRVGSIER